MKTKILYGVIGALILVILVILGSGIYDQQIIKAEQRGYQVGLMDSVISVIQNSRDCQPVNLFVGNQSFQFIDVACLNVQQ